jgi:ribose-phosphate pyrophosphokinase
MILLNCSNAGKLGRLLAKKLRIKSYNNLVKKFSDNETYIKLGSDVKNQEVIIIQSLSFKPDEYLMELLFTARTAKSLGAKKIKLLIPYLAYSRQDARFEKNECFTSKEVAHYLNHSGADELIIIDPHLRRIKKLKQLFRMKIRRVSASKDLALYIKKLKLKNPFILAPDEGARELAQNIAEILRVDFDVLIKKRTAKSVSVKSGNKSFKNKEVVLVDDILSSGGTMKKAAELVKKRGAKSAHCVVVHGLFIKNVKELKKIFKTIASTNTVQTSFTKIDLSKTISGLF